MPESDTDDAMVKVTPKGVRVNWTAISGFGGVIAAVGVAVGGYFQARADVDSLSKQAASLEKRVETLNDKREDTGKAIEGMSRVLDGIDKRLGRIERHLDRKD